MLIRKTIAYGMLASLMLVVIGPLAMCMALPESRAKDDDRLIDVKFGDDTFQISSTHLPPLSLQRRQDVMAGRVYTVEPQDSGLSISRPRFLHLGFHSAVTTPSPAIGDRPLFRNVPNASTSKTQNPKLLRLQDAVGVPSYFEVYLMDGYRDYRSFWNESLMLVIGDFRGRLEQVSVFAQLTRSTSISIAIETVRSCDIETEVPDIVTRVLDYVRFLKR